MKTRAFTELCGFIQLLKSYCTILMHKLSSSVIIALVAIGVFGTACNGASSSGEGANAAPNGKMFADKLPETAKPIEISFRDMNAYTANDLFCIVSIVDNGMDQWQQIWVKTELIDANGNILTVNGDSSILLQTFSDAVPPRGATAFFSAIPLSQVSGVPVNCRLEGAGAITRPPGPILIATEVGGVRAMYADKDDPTKIVEKTFNLQAVIENPLDLMAYRPKMVLLVYGKDYKLYFAQMVGLDDPNAPLKQEREGPFQPQEKRNISCLIMYDQLPKPLQEMLIGRVDVQVHEAR